METIGRGEGDRLRLEEEYGYYGNRLGGSSSG
jgi:hypothetical protein